LKLALGLAGVVGAERGGDIDLDDDDVRLTSLNGAARDASFNARTFTGKFHTAPVHTHTHTHTHTHARLRLVVKLNVSETLLKVKK